MLSYTLMSAADAAFVGRLGTEPLAAIGLSITVLFLVRAYGIGLVQGVRVLTAQCTGAEDREAVFRLGWQSLWLSTALGALAMVLIPVGGPIFGLMGAAGEVRTLATEYFVIRLLFAPIDFASFGLTVWFQGRGDTRTPMVANVGANVLNIGLDALLIFGLGPIPALGIGGAAWATNIARAVGGAYLLWRALPHLVGVSAGLSRDLLRRTWALGHPIGVMDFFDVGAFTLFTAILTSAGEVELAAHVVVIRIISVSFLPGYAIGSAAGVLVGQAVGARRPVLAGQAIRSALVLAVSVMAVFGVVFVVAPGPLLGLFGAEPAVAETGRKLLIIAATFQLFDAVAMVLYSALNGAGDTRFVMRASLGASWLVMLPVAYVLAIPAGLGAAGAWVGFVAELALISVIFAWRVRSGRWLVFHSDPPEPAPVRTQ
jgi:MATE family multidrug resistance protein